MLCDVKLAGAGALAVSCVDCGPMLRTKQGDSEALAGEPESGNAPG